MDTRLKVARVAGVIGIGAYVASWLANHEVPGFRDPLILRAIIVALLGATLVATYVSAWTVKNLPTVIRALVYVVTLHDYLLLVWNQLDAMQVIGTYLVLAGVVATSSLFVLRARDLGAYLLTVAGLSVLAVVLVDRPRTAEAQFLIGIVTFTALSYVAVRGHLHTLRRLRESEVKAQAVIQAVPDLLVQIDRDAVVQAILGQPRGKLAEKVQALVGRPLYEIFERQPDAGESLVPGDVRGFSAPITGSDPAIHVEVRLVRGDDAGRLALLRDVTRERQLEARLRVNDRLAAIGTLASGLGHEINNPLSYVIANVKYAAKMLRLRIGNASDGDEELSALEDARRGAERIGVIVSSLKNYASGAETLELAAGAEDCVRSALNVLATEIRHRAILAVELGPMPRLRVEPLRMTQVLVNLITNACQALPDTEPPTGHIWIRGKSQGASAIIEVQDDGTGIKPSDLVHVFDPFFTTKSPGQGTGLGLYVCHQIITAFGGTIEVQSEEGTGTTFRVVVPSLEGPVATVAAQGSTKSQAKPPESSS